MYVFVYMCTHVYTYTHCSVYLHCLVRCVFDLIALFALRNSRAVAHTNIDNDNNSNRNNNNNNNNNKVQPRGRSACLYLVVVVAGITACSNLCVFKPFKICIKTKSAPRLHEVLVY